MYQILKDVPLPVRHRKSWLDNIPWSSLIVGDCVEIPTAGLVNIKSARGDLYGRAISEGYRVTTTVTEKKIEYRGKSVSETLLRMWRVE